MTQSLGRLLSLMDDFTAAPGHATPMHHTWDAKEDEEALHLCVDMPGLGKEHINVWAE
jgi:HSP20 family protein